MKTNEILSVGLKCWICVNHIMVKAINPTQNVMRKMAKDHVRCSQCGHESMCYVGESVVHESVYQRGQK